VIVKKRIEMTFPRGNDVGIHAEIAPDRPDLGPILLSA
jgi:hypothetical protein